MTIYIPGAMFAAGISLYLFYEYNRAKEAKLDERRESLNDKRQQYLHQLIEVKRNEQGAAEDLPITGPQGEESESHGSNGP